MSQLLEIALRNKGYVTAADAQARGIQNREFAQALRRGELVKLERGLYCTPDTWEDEYVVAQHRYAKGIFSHDTALYLLGLSDSAPEMLTMTFPRSYNPSSAKKFGIRTKSSPQGLHSLGITKAVTPYGNVVRIYGPERTLCDMLRGISTPDLQLLSPAFRRYLSSGQRSLPDLQSFAAALGVSAKVRRYLKVLL